MLNFLINRLKLRLANIPKIIEDECFLIILGRNNIKLHISRDGLTLLKQYFIEGKEYNVKNIIQKDIELYEITLAYITPILKDIIRANDDFSLIKNETSLLFISGLKTSVNKKSLMDIAEEYLKEERYGIDTEIFVMFLMLNNEEKMKIKLELINDLLKSGNTSFLLKTKEELIINPNSNYILKQEIPVRLLENVLMGIKTNMLVYKTYGIYLKFDVTLTNNDEYVNLILVNDTNEKVIIEKESIIASVYFTPRLEVILTR